MKNDLLNKIERVSLRTITLLALTAEMIDDITGLTSLRGRKGIYDFSRKLNMGEYQLRSALFSLEEQNLIEKNGNGFLITPKGLDKAKILKLQNNEIKIEKWDGKWRIVIFDIPEEQRKARNILRSILKRNRYIRLQDSVFVSPYGDFELLNSVRHEYKIEKYVNFFKAKADELENDLELRRRFNLI
ncbi:MAG: CRISPR-associated endonuclease Cas2 [Candidatus Berkelbacteria bacterium]|nr:CRISPR-associated endonuclease Cas2 [Candidatus Berkelbacteria bacterium]